MDASSPRNPDLSTPAAPATVRRLMWAAVGLAGLLMLIGLFVDQDPKNDVASCYARQVREFAAGNWEGAFFHMTPPLVIVLGGLVAKLGIPAFAALKLVSGCFFVAALWPLSRLLRRIVPPHVAAWGGLLYATHPRLVRYSAGGLLDSAKMFLLIWLAELLLTHAEKPKLRYAAGIGVVAGGLALARAEGLFFLPLAVAGMLLLPQLQQDAERGFAGRLRNVWRSAAHAAAAVALAALVCLPQILYIRAVTGFPALDSRQTTRIPKLLHKWVPHPLLPEKIRNWTPPPPDAAALGRDRSDIPEEDVKTPWRSVKEAVKGLDTFLLALAAAGLCMKLRRRDWNAADAVCAAVIVYNALLFASSGFITKRYTVTTIPFLLAWSAAGVAVLKAGLFDRFLPRAAFPVVGGAVILLSAANGAKGFVNHENPRLEFGRWVQAHRGELVKPAPVRLVSSPAGNDYHDGRQPLVAATTPQYSYWAEADWVVLSHRLAYTPDEVRQAVQQQHADLLVVDRDLLEICPDLKPETAPWLQPVPGAPANLGWSVYRVRPPAPESHP